MPPAGKGFGKSEEPARWRTAPPAHYERLAGGKGTGKGYRILEEMHEKIASFEQFIWGPERISDVGTWKSPMCRRDHMQAFVNAKYGTGHIKYTQQPFHRTTMCSKMKKQLGMNICLPGMLFFEVNDRYWLPCEECQDPAASGASELGPTAPPPGPTAPPPGPTAPTATPAP
jgi:hypothetical protein